MCVADVPAIRATLRQCSEAILARNAQPAGKNPPPKKFSEFLPLSPGFSSGFSRRLQCTYWTTNVAPYSRLRVSNRLTCALPMPKL